MSLLSYISVYISVRVRVLQSVIELPKQRDETPEIWGGSAEEVLYTLKYTQHLSTSNIYIYIYIYVFRVYFGRIPSYFYTKVKHFVCWASFCFSVAFPHLSGSCCHSSLADNSVTCL